MSRWLFLRRAPPNGLLSFPDIAGITQLCVSKQDLDQRPTWRIDRKEKMFPQALAVFGKTDLMTMLKIRSSLGISLMISEYGQSKASYLPMRLLHLKSKSRMGYFLHRRVALILASTYLRYSNFLQGLRLLEEELPVAPAIIGNAIELLLRSKF